MIRCEAIWLVLLLASSFFLMVASTLTIVYRLKSRAPELSMNWSTMTRDSPYVNQTDTLSALTDARRSRVIKGLKVRFGDVEPEKEIGHLAVAVVDDSHTVGPIQRTRVYD